MKFEIERGSFESIKRKKRRNILMTFLMVFIGCIMFIVGLFMNQFERSNLCTMLAILMVLPATKYLVAFIVVFPYKSVSKERYEHITNIVPENTIVMTDMVITSTEKVMNLDFVIITDNQVLGLVGKKNQDALYIEKYIDETLETYKIDGFVVKIFENEKKFEDSITDRKFEKTNLQEEAYKTIRTLVC